MVEEEDLLEAGLDRLRRLLGERWTVEAVNRNVPADAAAWMTTAPTTEQIVNIYSRSGGGGSGQVLVEATRSLTPARAAKEFGPKLALMHSLTGSAAVLVIAPWLSPRTRETLERMEYGYLDLTGNISLRLQQPTIVIQTEGAKRDPSPQGQRARQQLRGARVGRLVRVLVDAEPPYRATELADASAVSLSYVSRLLDALEEENLIRRDGRTVTDVDWLGLLRERAAQYRLLDANPYVSMLAPDGIGEVLTRIRRHSLFLRQVGELAVTGPLAVRTVLPHVSVGGQLMIYVPPDPRHNGALESIAVDLGLLRSEIGADVLLLRASTDMVFNGTREIDGVPYVALSQLALDSLSGTGRMPNEGEELLEYMAANVMEWRARKISRLPWLKD
jgi:hypothetical protein